MMFPATTLLVLTAAFIALRLPRNRAVTVRAAAGDWRLLLRNKRVRRLLAFTFGAFLCLQGPIAQFPVYVRSLGGDMDTIGRMWVLMLLLEIPLVAFSGAGLARVGARGLLAIGAAAGGLRWALCGFSNYLPLVYASQLLHGVVVTGLFIGGPLYLEAIVPERLRSTAQTLLSMVTFCAAGILSNITTGWLIEHVGVTTPYAIGGVGAIILGCAVPWILPAPVKKPESPPGRWEDGVSG
jgi:PPP family 3-phenylpropionic acid transporter